ncbi:MAG TPA: S-adenosylmethionine:tRNA ribosyltransferase-isomerase, partial [Acidimicrobiales bacterium]|nr:S-adenosylmethionine:tRNA ribosyltransferase-isomerase [Acidimicrobiales bacterium]
MPAPQPTMASYDYALPDAAIAQEPVEPRDAARLLVALGPDVVHARVRDLPELLRPGDLLVANDTRVLPARLRLHKATGGAAEVLLLEQCGPGPDDWEALVRPGRRLPPGTVLAEGDGRPLVEVGARTGEGTWRVRLLAAPWAAGEVPLPPYVHRPLRDPERYQTVFAARPGSIAAPTAGLHLTDGVLDACRARGVGFATVDLQVGLGTFKPVSVDDPADHRMHSEAYRVPEATWAACGATRAAGGRV